MAFLFLLFLPFAAVGANVFRDLELLCRSKGPPDLAKLWHEHSEHPADESRFTAAYLATEFKVVSYLQFTRRLDPDAAEEGAQIAFTQVWTGELKWPGDKNWPDEKEVNWLANAAQRTGVLASVRAINLTPDADAGQGDWLSSMASSGPLTDLRLTQDKIDLLPDGLHR